MKQETETELPNPTPPFLQKDNSKQSGHTVQN